MAWWDFDRAEGTVMPEFGWAVPEDEEVVPNAWEGRRHDILGRIESGYYDTPERHLEIARRILEDLKLEGDS